jgi:hypothetical protein
MPSPFPGMDPYIESSGRWSDFHLNMVSAIRGQLNARLPSRFVASSEQYVWVHEQETRRRRGAPDVFVTDRSEPAAPATVTTVVAAPTTIMLPAVKRERKRYVQIVDRETKEMVTAIELLSPTNKKAGEDREFYLFKRKEYVAARVSLIEIDLLRGGRRLPLSDPPPDYRDYYLMICRSWEHPRADFWTMTVREPLPELPIPLAEDVPAVPLDLRACIDRVYDEGRYGIELNYDEPLTPRPGKRDAAWIEELLVARASGEGGD